MAGDLIGKRIGRYEIQAELEQSELVNAYRAFDTRLERTVLMKVMRRSQEYSGSFRDYFLQEARSLAQLSHPNIARLLDFGHEEGLYFLIMEMAVGERLSAKLAQPMPWQEAVDLLIPTAEALDYAHRQNAIHRDLKPENIVITADGQPLLTDFSVARIIEEEETREMTGTNVGLGSPEYMSPEQGKGHEIDHRADIYALGIIFFEMVTGRKPFLAESSMEVVIQQVTMPPPSPKKFAPQLPDAVEQVILTMLKKDPDERFETMGELAEVLKRVRQGEKYRPQRQRAASGRVPLNRGPVLWAALLGTLGVALIAATLIMSGIIALPGAPAEPTVVAHIAATQPPEPTAAPTLTFTPTPTRTPDPTSTPKPTGIPTLPPPAWNFPKLPVTVQEPLPSTIGKISTTNVDQITELARWGSPQFEGSVWSLDDRSLISATSSGVYLYSPSDLSFQGFFDTDGWATCIDLSPDGKWIATGHRSGVIKVWDAENTALVRELSGHTAAVTTLKFDRSGKFIVSGSDDSTVRIWATASWAEKFNLTGHAYDIRAALFSPDGSMVISGSTDFQMILWDAATGEQLGGMRSAQMIYDLAITSDNRYLAAALNNASIEIWDLSTRSLVRTLRDSEMRTPVNSVSFSPSNQLLATGSDDGLVRIWNVSGGTLLWQLEGGPAPTSLDRESGRILQVAFSRDGTQLFGRALGGRQTVWDMKNHEPVSQVEMPFMTYSRIEISPDGNTILLENAAAETVEIRNLNDGKNIGTVEGRLLRGSTFSNDSTIFALMAPGKLDQINFFDIKGKRSGNWSTTLFSFPVNGVLGFMPNGKFYIKASDRQVIVEYIFSSAGEIKQDILRWNGYCQLVYEDAETQRLLVAGSKVGVFTSQAEADAMCSIQWNPRALDESYIENPRQLIYGLDNQKVEIWNGADEMKPTLLDLGQGKVLGVAQTADGTLLFATTEGGTIEVWDVKRGEQIKVIDAYDVPAADVVLTPDGRYLITLSQDGMIEIWGIAP